MLASSVMTCSAISASAVSSAVRDRATASCTSWVIVDEVVDDRVELVEVGIAHAGNRTEARWTPGDRDPVTTVVNAR